MMPNGPQYTFRIKSDTIKVQDTPAPNSYNIPTTVQTPLYTISGRHKEPIDERLKVPSPGTYNPEKSYKFVLTYSPQYTFGVKIQTDKYADSPAPNTYRIPSVLDTPVYTLSGRHKIPVDDRALVPAPGTYSPEKVQLSKTPQITFGIKHSPRLGQLRPITPQQQTENDTARNVSTPRSNTGSPRYETQYTNENISNNTISQNYVDDSNESNINVYDTRTHVTHIRSPSEARSTTATPEPVQETLTQEIVWLPEKPIRRGSYTIDKSDGNGTFERYNRNEVVPVEGGVVHLHESGERGGSNTSQHYQDSVEREGYKQVTDKSVSNTNAFEKKQSGSQEVRTNTDVQHLPNGGTSTTTTTTTVKKIGTAAKAASSTANVTRTKVAVTSRDVGAK
uniref:Simila to CG8086 n=1 Tax=Papilio polytes TaxID=76194 RepID=I4DRC1_PAPPL|nr:simila to CG8086 [Papilio polytes]